MKTVKKIFKLLLIAILALLALAAAADAAWIFIPQIKAQSPVDGLEDIARSTDDISVPASARVFALGEASHGNVEFQQLKLSVLQQLVEKGNVRAFALEADFGEGMVVDRYIHGLGELSSAEEAVGQLSFNIYHTEQMLRLVEWMRDYNLSAAPGKQLSFYGFDLQNPRTGLRLLLQYCEENAILPELSKTPVQAYIDGSFSIADEQAGDALCCLELIAKELESRENDKLAAPFLNVIACAQNFVICLDEGGAANYIRYNNERDSFMAANVLWIADYAAAQSGGKLMIAGHNGHVAYAQQFYTPMGSHLKAAPGDDYFVIGTDYYKTTCNINAAGPDATRGDYRFCSGDPLAAGARKLSGSYYLDFAEASAQNGETARLLDTELYMGSLGEGYTWTMHLLPMSHRIKARPSELYDAMIFVYEATPIRVS